jgi:hypothetical protein
MIRMDFAVMFSTVDDLHMRDRDGTTELTDAAIEVIVDVLRQRLVAAQTKLHGYRVIGTGPVVDEDLGF